MNRRIIMLTGYKRSGKDTVGKFLKEFTNGEILKFAEPLRNMVKDFLDIDDEIIEREKETKPFYFKNKRKIDYIGEDMSIRDLMITFSEGLKQYYGKDIFCRYVERRIKESDKKIFIITDLRYTYEAEYFRNRFPNTLIVRICRKGVELSSNHSSETEIDNIKPDIVISNDGTIEKLKEKVFMLSKSF